VERATAGALHPARSGTRRTGTEGPLIAGTVALVRYSRLAGTDRREQPPPATAEQLLAERYARGEIDETEYRRRLDTLEANGARRP
jgi:putative membrane protein